MVLTGASVLLATTRIPFRHHGNTLINECSHGSERTSSHHATTLFYNDSRTLTFRLYWEPAYFQPPCHDYLLRPDGLVELDLEETEEEGDEDEDKEFNHGWGHAVLDEE